MTVPINVFHGENMVASSDHIENKKLPFGSVALLVDLLTVSAGSREISLAQQTGGFSNHLL